MELQWTWVPGAWVAELSSPCHKKKKTNGNVNGYVGLGHREVPQEVLSAAKEHGWEHFGRVDGIPDVFIVGPNKCTHLQTAKLVKREFGRSDEQWPEDMSNDMDSQPEKSGGVKAWFEGSTLMVEAKRYDKKGADPKLILQEIGQATEGCESFHAQICLKGLWWSPGTCAARRQSSERCAQVLFGLRGLGCRRFIGVLDLSQNDLDDEFLVELLNLLRGTNSMLDVLNLDENRITSRGVVQLLPELRSFVRNLKLNNNAIDQAQFVRKEARKFGIFCEAGPDWTNEAGRQALDAKDAWWDFFYGPVQLLRTKILDLPQELAMVECPICQVVLKQDMRQGRQGKDPAYTVSGNLATHLCGEKHRKKLWCFLNEKGSENELPSILIVSKSWSIMVHPLSGQMKIIQREDALLPPTTDTALYAEPEAIAVRAAMWLEGRQMIASQPESLELAWEILSAQAAAKGSEVKIEADPDLRDLKVGQIEYTQESIGECFKDGRSLEALISDLDHSRVDPCSCKDLQLEVIERDGKYFSNDNRRLYCLKRHQEHMDQEHMGWTVWVKAKVFYWPSAFDRFLTRYQERQAKIGDRDDPNYIRVRRKNWNWWR